MCINYAVTYMKNIYNRCFNPVACFSCSRDGFYELIREWEASRMNPDYKMAEMFGQRVRAIVNVRTDLANMIHFARLFQSQLIAVRLLFLTKIHCTKYELFKGKSFRCNSEFEKVHGHVLWEYKF